MEICHQIVSQSNSQNSHHYHKLPQLPMFFPEEGGHQHCHVEQGVRHTFVELVVAVECRGDLLNSTLSRDLLSRWLKLG